MPDYGFGVSVAQTGLDSARLSLQVTANNLANMATPGFQAALPSRFTAAAVARPTGLWAGAGAVNVLPEAVAAGTVQGPSLVNMQTGPLRPTGVATDFALSVPGYFPIGTRHGIAYTRNGAFHQSPQGMLVTAQGHPLLGLNMKPIVVKGPLTVHNGSVYTAQGKLAAKLAVARFTNPNGLQNVGGSLLAPTRASGAATYLPALGLDVQAGYLEGSNVSLANAMGALISEQVQFTMSAKALQQASSLAATTAQMAKGL